MSLWVFGYGSLMWRPGFRFQRAEHARLVGFSRSFCVFSMHHRGCETRPGLVLGLDRGGACEGMAFHIAEEDVPATLAYLREREQVSGVYREVRLPITLLNTQRQHVHALTYVVERAHPSYASRLPLQIQARLIRGACGTSGDNITYVLNTMSHLSDLGIRERQLERLLALIGPLVASRQTINGAQCPHVTSLSRAVRNQFRVRQPLRLSERRRFIYRQKIRQD
ncbi:Gamma-glutamyl cyclotransferase [Candidatus Filomicrobium marinum]|uniref:glutathione-specific gamma-glutamylcyclotransferase n=1 Tax=Candidatus Filomicrobium marinum TaxID=1608628 RepID=A0A0D6JFR6_9HYPH|nr:Gamma-glutamyl cyclotransferase [Candidatus Filomicrobium marinum]